MHFSRMRTARLLTVSKHTLRRGGGVCPGGGICPGGCLTTPPPPWTELQTGVKTLHCRNFVAGGNEPPPPTSPPQSGTTEKSWIRKWIMAFSKFLSKVLISGEDLFLGQLFQKLGQRKYVIIPCIFQ